MEYLFLSLVMNFTEASSFTGDRQFPRNSSQTSLIVKGRGTCVDAIKAATGATEVTDVNGIIRAVSDKKHPLTIIEATCIPNRKD